ncbi:MAG: response regulator transcription factor [Phycisphaeraceae bacterium]|nr:response regulator transcription factor [Phycisphaeraceae bacterium]
MKKQHVLVIEDDHAIRQGIVDALQYAGYRTFEADRGDRGLEMAVEVDCDLILLDLVLPGGVRGLDILEHVRKTRPTMPVIIITAMGDETDRIRGLELGADDYVVKPFSVKELLARVQAVLRRSAERPTDLKTIRLPNGVSDLEPSEVQIDGEERRELSEKEVQLLRYLAQNPGRAVSRQEILSNVWRINPRGLSTRTIDMHVTRLREKLHDDPSSPQIILTVRGKGYMYGETKEQV